MELHKVLREKVLAHGAINNPYLTRFAKGDLDRRDLEDFSIQFYSFVKHFPRVLATLLANTDDAKAADELCIILASELGNGKPEHRHEYLYHRYLQSIGLDPKLVLKRGVEFETEDFVRGMVDLYGHRDYGVALGASFGLENMAITMWDHLIPGLRAMKAKPEFADMDLKYFTFHRALEQEHEDSMEEALRHASDLGVDSLRYGIDSVLNVLQRMWMGLEKRWHLRRGLKAADLPETYALPRPIV